MGSLLFFLIFIGSMYFIHRGGGCCGGHSGHNHQKKSEHRYGGNSGENVK
ncbi:hypothetical protein [Anoxybacter fermentans]|nr:hypothetical protein [Anoxybacter fermentans]